MSPHHESEPAPPLLPPASAAAGAVGVLGGVLGGVLDGGGAVASFTITVAIAEAGRLAPSRAVSVTSAVPA